ncbi:MAG TPA: NADP oxidoreductase [Anaerolineae bacterium]|nr:NADP oxidoreductase [Anaerolineae bacterium]HQH37722.1 NADP oxidoreductase [Anaerolineae bacterium]
MGKVTVAMQWLEACAGCEMSFLDIDERIVELLKHVELSSTPITDLKHPPQSGVDVGILSGGIGNEEEEEEAKLMRSRCKTLIAMGDCAVTGGICTMRNFFSKEEVLRRGYIETESTVDGEIPQHEDLTPLTDKVVGVGDVVPVDVFLPGCPPSADAIWFVLTELLAGRTPKLEGKVLKYGMDG